METTADISGIRLVGGAPAVDFLNTRVGPPGGGAPTDDVLRDYAHVLAWAVYAGVVGEDAAAALETAARDSRAAGDAWHRALTARDAVDDVLRPIAVGEQPAPAAMERLARMEADALSGARIAPADGAGESPYAWSWDGDTSLDRPIREIVHSATQLVLTLPHSRLKECAGCSFLFVDESKNRSRRWCSMDDCGTAQKMRRYVAARRERAARA